MTSVSISILTCCVALIFGESGYNQEQCVLTANYESVSMEVSAYCKESCCCGKWADGFTASGAVAEGLIVAAPQNIPFGTQIYIPGYGLATVEDRGGAIKGNKLDILMDSHKSALKWGRKQIKCIFLTKEY